MGWNRDLKAVLAGEPETWLCYLRGQQTSNLPLLTGAHPETRIFSEFSSSLEIEAELSAFNKLTTAE